MRSAGLMLLLFAACARPSREQCVEVIDRYVDMRAGDDIEVTRAPESVRAEVRDARRAAKRLENVYDARISQCQREVSRSAVRCGMKANGPDEWEACFR